MKRLPPLCLLLLGCGQAAPDEKPPADRDALLRTWSGLSPSDDLKIGRWEDSDDCCGPGVRFSRVAYVVTQKFGRPRGEDVLYLTVDGKLRDQWPDPGDDWKAALKTVVARDNPDAKLTREDLKSGAAVQFEIAFEQELHGRRKKK